jgi:ribosomal protein S18 acetylase RimI-like enzyme
VSAAPEIRRAVADDLPWAAAALALAFADYPWTRWVVDERDHLDRLEGLYAIYLRVALELGQVWVSDDASAVAAWTSSRTAAAQDELFAREGLATRVAALSGDRLGNVATGIELLAPHTPSEDHWVLAAVGVVPGRQREGLGRRVLEPALADLDARGEAAVLDTSTASNVGLYERLGFAVTAELQMPAGGPRVWLMKREPR